jgi:hypothetical protein
MPARSGCLRLEVVANHRHNRPKSYQNVTAPEPRSPVDITQLLAFSVKNKASDLHLSAGLPPMIRVTATCAASTSMRWTTRACTPWCTTS